MKTIFCVALLLAAVSCTKDSDEDNQSNGHPYGNDGLSAQDGEWHLKSIMSFGPSQEFEINDYMWSIDSDQESVFIEENLDIVISVFIPAGEHAITFTTDSLFVDSLGYGYFFDQDDLFITYHPELDGPIYQFIRPE